MRLLCTTSNGGPLSSCIDEEQDDPGGTEVCERLSAGQQG